MPSIFIRAITPKRQIGLDAKRFLPEVKKELKDLGKDVADELAKPTRQWNNPPQFKADIRGGINQIVMIVGPIGSQAEKYNRIDFGTAARTIVPRKQGGVLKFNRFYLASTIPNLMWSRQARRSGYMVYTKIVHNNKIRARNFSMQAYKKYNPELRKRMENLIRREVRRGGV